ncbi:MULTISPECIES: hypothetical protein [Streptomyces]|nr:MULTISPECIES: hypothetical protein [Streptomyces]
MAAGQDVERVEGPPGGQPERFQERLQGDALLHPQRPELLET